MIGTLSKVSFFILAASSNILLNLLNSESFLRFLRSLYGDAFCKSYSLYWELIILQSLSLNERLSNSYPCFILVFSFCLLSGEPLYTTPSIAITFGVFITFFNLFLNFFNFWVFLLNFFLTFSHCLTIFVLKLLFVL